MGLLNRLDTLKFAAHLDHDGYPTILPALSCLALGAGRLLVATTGNGRQLRRVSAGATVALLALNLKLESVLLRGSLQPSPGLLRPAALELDRVNNSMPPQQGQIFPAAPLEPVRMD